MQREPTRGENILDLVFTNKPSLVKSYNSIPGFSDHDIVVTDCSIRAHVNKKAPRNILLWKRADWVALQAEANKFIHDFLTSANLRSMNENYTKLKNFLTQTIEKHVPSKILKSSQHRLPWINQSIRRMCRKNQRLYNKAKRSHKNKDWLDYRSHNKATVQAIRRSHWRYVNSVLLEGLESNDPKPFWHYIKSQRQDAFGISPVKLNGTLHSDPREKANNQFKSVFTTREPPGSTIPKLEVPRFPSIDSLSIRVEGVQKLLSNLNVTKASDPDNISCKILCKLSTELAPVLCNIFQQSIHTGQIPHDWTT